MQAQRLDREADNPSTYWTSTIPVATSPGDVLPSDSSDCRLVGANYTIHGARCVDADGNYAYVAAGDSGLRVIDVSDKANPVEVGSYLVGYFVYNVTKSGNYVYAMTGSVHIIDVSDPTNPVETSDVNTTGFDYGIDIVGNYGYVAHWSSDFAIVDLSDPLHPSIVGECVTPYRAVWADVADSYAYISLYDSGMAVIDVSNPADPGIVGRYDSIEAGKCERIAVDGGYAYLTESAALVVLDISDPTDPQKIGFLGTPSYAGSVSKVGSYAYVTCGRNGLRVIDVSDPPNPTEVGHYRPSNSITHVAVIQNYIYAVSGDSVFQIIKFYGGGIGGRIPSSVYRSPSTATIVRRVLFLTGNGGRETEDWSMLADAAGRGVMELQLGANDVQHLSPGVYFISSPGSPAPARSIRRVVLTR